MLAIVCFAEFIAYFLSQECAFSAVKLWASACRVSSRLGSIGRTLGLFCCCNCKPREQDEGWFNSRTVTGCQRIYHKKLLQSRRTMIGSAVAVVCSCIAGSIWYNPKSPTGRLWMRRYHPGKSPEECGSEMGVAMGLTLVANLMMSLLLRFILIDTFHATSLLDGVKFGVGLSCLTTLLNIPHVLFSKHYVDAFIVDQVYNLIITTAAAVCIVYFG